MTRLPTDRYTFPWGDAELCPCGQGSRYVDCCKRQRQLPYLVLPNLQPPGEITGFGNTACYMASTMNCSKGRSREHYVSEAILKRFDQLSVSGMPWQQAGQSQILPTKALVANILCERHNSALAPIDTAGLRAFDAFISAARYAVNNRYHGRAEHYLISGEGLELWMYKLMAGLHFGGIAAAAGRVARDNFDFPVLKVAEALTSGKLPQNAGLIVTQNAGLVQPNQIGAGPLIDVEKGENIGVQVQFGALRFETTITPPPITSSHSLRLAPLRRPRAIDFVGLARDARVILSWKGWANEVKRVAVEVRPD